MSADKKRAVAIAVFVLYSIVLLFLLFNRVPMAERSMNLRPFFTIKNQWEFFRRDDPLALSLRRYSTINLGGNVAVFIPLGYFLPQIFKKQRSFLLFTVTVILLICAVEFTQYMTRLGAMDIDDLILNIIGAVIGFAIWKLVHNKRK